MGERMTTYRNAETTADAMEMLRWNLIFGAGEESEIIKRHNELAAEYERQKAEEG